MTVPVAYHSDGYRPARPAVNVKVYYGGMPSPYTDLLAVLGERDTERLYESAEGDVYARFWSDARDVADSLGLGPIEQEGRSGGWLVLTDGYDPEDERCIDEHGIIEQDKWLTAYRALSDWCADQVREAPARVARLAQQLAMDAIGAEPARRMFAFDQERADYLAARASETLSYGDILYAQGQDWCSSSPDGMGPHRPDGDTCAECGATIERTVLA